MWLKNTFELFRNMVICKIEDLKVFPFTYLDKTLYRLILNHKGCIRIYINDVKVKKRSSYVCSQYKNSKSLKIKVRGLFSSKTLFISLIPPAHFEHLNINFPVINKKEGLKNKQISYRATKRYKILEPN